MKERMQYICIICIALLSGFILLMQNKVKEKR